MVSVRYTDNAGVAHRPTAYARTEAEARRRLREMQRRIEDGQNPVDASMSVGEWMEQWISGPLEASDRRPSTKDTYVSLTRTHLIPALGQVKLRALNPGHIRDLVIDLRSRRSASTVRQTLQVLNMALTCAVKDGLLRANPVDRVDRPKRTHKEADWYPSETVSLLRRCAEGERWEPLLTLVAYTGLRKGEALALRWEDIALDAQDPHLRVTGTLSRRSGGRLDRSDTKTASGRRSVPLVPEAVDAIKRARSQQRRERMAAGVAWTDTPFVFTTAIGTPIDPRNALAWFYRVRRRAAATLMVADPECSHGEAVAASGRCCSVCGKKSGDYLSGSWHTLRHSAASVLLGSGIPMPIVKDILGHSSITITVDMYGHMAPTLVAQAMATGMSGYGAV